jgi:3-oxoacyl-[acyl-carrier protein] reductase
LFQKGDTALLQYCANQDKLLAAVQELGENCRVVAADFSMPGAVERFCAEIGEPDILINAAAVTRTDLLVNLSDQDIEKMLLVNVLAAVKICRKVIPGMVARRQGCIVNISSVAAQRGNRGQTVYAGSKGFIESFTRAMAAEYGARGIRINCVAPGPIEAGSLSELMGHAAPEVKKSVAAPKLGTPADVAAAVAFLCSGGAAFINGKSLPVDGGFQQGV